MRDTDRHVAQGFLKTVRFAAAHYGFLGGLARWLMMLDERRSFVQAGGTTQQRRLRRELIARFDHIQRKVPCAHSPHQFVLLARYLLDLKVEGPLVACGCYKGGSAAKLSVLAEACGRRLYVCDSFQGLPAPRQDEPMSFAAFHPGFPAYEFAAGQYRASQEEVRETIREHGCLGTCELVPGWFRDSLPHLDVRPALVYLDVDLVSSARDCLEHLWPRTVNGGIWFTHEAVFPAYLEGMLDRAWWQANLGESPPLVFGAGSGLSPVAASLAYFVKG